MSTGVAGAHTMDEDRVVGQTVAGKYRIDARIGAGSMGAIYRARHLTLDKDVCVKIMHDDVACDPSLACRFQREAHVASRLDHPCSVRVLDFGEEFDGRLYLVMELIEGRDLFELLDDGPLAPPRIVDILTQALSALAAAHDVGILHRDLKPENIMVARANDAEDGVLERVKVCDFGIAHMIEPNGAGPRITSRGFIVGTPEYMSPEQTRSETPDPRSDLYSIGVILFQLLTGRLPFEADSPVSIALKHLGEEPRRPRDLNPNAHPALEAICLRALRKSPADRYQSAREMRRALRSALGQTEPRPVTLIAERETLTEGLDSTDEAAAPIALPLTTRNRAFERRSSKRASAFVAVALLVGLGSVGFVRRQHLALPRIAMVNAAAALLERPPAPVATLAATAEPALTASVVPAATEPAPVEPPVPVAAPSRAPAPSRVAVAVAAARSPKPERATPERTRAPIAAPEPPPRGPHRAAPRRGCASSAPIPLPMPQPTPAAAPRAPTPAAPAPAATPSTTAPGFSLESAHVDVGTAAQLVGATSTSIERAIAPSRAKLDACYREALPQLGGALDGFAILHLDTDEVGNIRRAEVKGAHAATVGACIARAVVGTRVRNVDTGTASADVPLSYRAR